MNILKNWYQKNKKDILLMVGLSIFITIMHGINQSRIHRESAELYWKYVKPYLVQRYVSFSQDDSIVTSIPELSNAQHVLTYKSYSEGLTLSRQIESELRQLSPRSIVQSPQLAVELDRYNQTVHYINQKEKSWLYRWAKRAVKRDPVLRLDLTN